MTSRSLLEGDQFFQVPEVIDALLGHRVLAMELVQGVPLDHCIDLDQETRNQVWGHFKGFNKNLAMIIFMGDLGKLELLI